MRTERTTWLSNATAPNDTKPDATIVASTAQRAKAGRKQVATARPASSVATTAISSDPSPIPTARSSRKAASRNGESCFASLIVYPESGTRAASAIRPRASTATALAQGRPRCTQIQKAGKTSGTRIIR